MNDGFLRYLSNLVLLILYINLILSMFDGIIVSGRVPVILSLRITTRLESSDQQSEHRSTISSTNKKHL